MRKIFCYLLVFSFSISLLHANKLIFKGGTLTLKNGSQSITYKLPEKELILNGCHMKCDYRGRQLETAQYEEFPQGVRVLMPFWMISSVRMKFSNKSYNAQGQSVWAKIDFTVREKSGKVWKYDSFQLRKVARYNGLDGDYRELKAYVIDENTGKKMDIVIDITKYDELIFQAN